MEHYLCKAWVSRMSYLIATNISDYKYISVKKKFGQLHLSLTICCLPVVKELICGKH